MIIRVAASRGRTAAAADAEDGDENAWVREEDAEQGDEEALNDDVVQEESAGLRHRVAGQRQKVICAK